MSGIAEWKEALLSEISRQGPTRGLTGASAGVLLKRRFEDFNPRRYGSEKLRQLIEQQIPELRVVGASGGDVIYGLAQWRSIEAPAARMGSSLWKIWVSPSSPFSIAVDQETHAARKIERGDRRPSELEVPPASPEQHRQVAESFLRQRQEQLGPELAAELAAFLKDHPSWWMAWMEKLRESPTLNSDWLHFRHAALREALIEALKARGLDEQSAGTAIDAIRRSGRRGPGAEISGRPTAPGEIRSEKQPVNLLQLVRAVVDRMGEAELRNLTLRLGDVLDELNIPVKR